MAVPDEPMPSSDSTMTLTENQRDSMMTLVETQNPKDASPEEFKADWRLKSIFAVIGLLNFVVAVDATSVSVALPTISSDFGGTATEAFWAGTSFLVASCVFQPLISLLSDIFGRKSIILLAVLSFTLGAILAAISHGWTLMLVGRCIQGVGGGGIYTLTEILIADLIPLRERGKWFSIKSGSQALGTIVGPLIGGAFTESSASWRWLFWFNIPFTGLGLALIPVFFHLERAPVSVRESLAKVDYFGCVISIASLTSFLIPITWGGSMYSWDSWHTLVPLILGIAGMIGFVVYEAYFPTQPLIPTYLFNNLTICLSYLGIFLHGLVLWALVYYLPLYYEGVLAYSPVVSGLALFPECLTIAPLAVVTGIIITKYGDYRWALWAGWPLAVLGLGIIHLLGPHTSVPKWIFLNLPIGIACGVLFPSVQLPVQAAVNPEYITIAVTMTPFFRTLGQSVGVAIGGVVFQNRIRKQLSNDPSLGAVADKYASDASSLVEFIKTLPAGSSERTTLIAMYAKSLGVVWAVMCGIAAVGLLTSIFIKKYSLNQELTSKQRVRRSKADLESVQVPVEPKNEESYARVEVSD
ncbi:uncharacterized protein N7483_011610 [Penicillium malachiteum]|uniref:uncharacterized protein n=1 Tax=Penicillium malachiteum TaxID=1324776 RepID=UPI0025468030|nr:uncharacterized protein N7483_011610 [Penicillium malachiteum]KAJ5714429.1 hypothetical protein N7483_011610 [Penicillium malachiteum]